MPQDMQWGWAMFMQPAGVRPVALHAGSTCVMLSQTVAGHMPPTMTFQASKRFLFALLGIHLFLTNKEAQS